MTWNALLDGVSAQCDRVFGRAIQFTPVISQPDLIGSITVRAIFDDGAKKIETDGVSAVRSIAPYVDIAYTALSIAPEIGDQVEIDGQIYTMTDVAIGEANSWRCELHTGLKTRW